MTEFVASGFSNGGFSEFRELSGNLRQHTNQTPNTQIAMAESTDGYCASGSADGGAPSIAQLRLAEKTQFDAFKKADAEHDRAQIAEIHFQECSRLQTERCDGQKKRLHGAEQELDSIPCITKWNKVNGRVQKQGDIPLFDARRAKNLKARITLLKNDVKFSEKRLKGLRGRHKQALTTLGDALLKKQSTFLSWVQAQEATLAAQTAADEQAAIDAAEMATAAAAFVQGAEGAAEEALAAGLSGKYAPVGGRKPRGISPTAVERALRYPSFNFFQCFSVLYGCLDVY